MKKLKCLMFYLIKRISNRLILEVHLDETIALEFDFVKKILSNGYNLVIILNL